MTETLSVAIVSISDPGDLEYDELSELAAQWRSNSADREAISLSLFERIVLPICKGRRQSDNAQEGYIALVGALETWNPDFPFGPYARTVVKRAIRRSWNSLRYPISIPYAVAQGKARIEKGIRVDSEIEKACVFFGMSHSTLGDFDSTVPDYRESDNPEVQVSGFELSARIRDLISEDSVLSAFFGIHGKKIHADDIAESMGISRARLYQIVQLEIDSLRHSLKSYNLAE